MNIPQGSVKVTAGGILLVENQDYTVDYTLGRVKIINEGVLNSGTPVSISLENNSLFSVQKKSLAGTRIDYVENKDLNFGATLLNLTERPLTQKVNYGEEPISNTIWGMDANYQKESDLITKVLDMLPFYNSKTASHVKMSGEFANLIPGHSKAVGSTGTSYIDDFEGSTSGLDLSVQGNWKLASTPQLQPNLFPEAQLINDLRYGYNRALLCWYKIDPSLQTVTSLTPSNLRGDKTQLSNDYVREVLQTEVFPNEQTPNGQPVTFQTLDLTFYPYKKGPYNYDVAGTPLGNGISSYGINKNDSLNKPETRWGGIMRSMTTTDFEATNVEYIEFWMLDPFITQTNGTPEEYANIHGGQLYFDIGDVSEDVLKDGRKSYENGLPTPSTPAPVDTTVWGRVPSVQSLVNSFANDPAGRTAQDVGLDGLSDDDERTFFASYLQEISKYGTNSLVYQDASNDPSGDDYKHYLYDYSTQTIMERYQKYNGMEGNSPVSSNSGQAKAATNLPDVEDINYDNTLSETERYYQYKIDLVPSKMKIGENYIADIAEVKPQYVNGQSRTVKWYEFKIPIRSYTNVYGDIEDFTSIRFMRIFMRGFQEPVTCRLGNLELIQSQWRTYNYDLLSPGEYIPNDKINNTSFDLDYVNLEENGKRSPIPYVMPPGIQREINWGTTNLSSN